MNLFYEELPHVLPCGVPIKTDFRGYIKLVDVVKDVNKSETEKAIQILGMFENIDQIESVELLRTAQGELIDFLGMKKKTESNSEVSDDMTRAVRRPSYSFAVDFPQILADFLQYYNINLLTADLHWWAFLNLFIGLPPDSQMKTRIRYRTTNLAEIRDAKERDRIAKIQASIALPTECVMSDEEIGGVFW